MNLRHIDDFLSREDADDLLHKARKYEDLVQQTMEAREELNEAISEWVEKGPHGIQQAISDTLGCTREWVRRISGRYHYQVTREAPNGSRFIRMPANNVTPHREYEIRTKGPKKPGGEILGKVSGQELLDARKRQVSQLRDSDSRRVVHVQYVDISNLIGDKGVGNDQYS